MALEPLGGPSLQRISKMRQDERNFPDGSDSPTLNEMRASERIEDLSDYEEALSHMHQFSELDLRPTNQLGASIESN